jgi:hypothetical protein
MKTQQSGANGGGNPITAFFKSVFPRSERSTALDEYFTPRLARADRQLRVLSTRIKGSYRRGAVSWPAFARLLAQSSLDTPIDSLWGRGSRVQKTMHGLDIEIGIGVERLGTGEHGAAATSNWLVLAPGITVNASARGKPLVARPDASWSIDEENATGAERLRLLRDQGASSEAALQAMPPALTSARQRLIEKAAKIVCRDTSVFVVARPLPRAPDDPRDLGQASFELDAINDLVERTRAFAHALGTR